MEDKIWTQLQQTIPSPEPIAIAESRQNIDKWFAQTARLIQWDSIQSPVGILLVAKNERGICRVQFGDDVDTFMNTLDPSARTEQSADALTPVAHQFDEYFAGERDTFDVRVDESIMRPFQRQILTTIRQIPSGEIWTYGQVAKAINKPKASRAVGRALGTNPVPIIIPCHRIIGSSGKLTGYIGGIERKRALLHHEGAL